MTTDEIDAMLEEIALTIEGPGIQDFCGALSTRKKTKRQVRDEEVEMRARIAERANHAGYVRSFKSANGNDPLIELERIVESGGEKTYWTFRELQSCVSAGYVDVDAVVCLTQNSIPTPASFVAKINQFGREALADRAAQ